MPVRIIATGYGGPEVLAQEEFDAPELATDDVRVEVKAAGVNPFDAKSYSGIYGTDPDHLPIHLGFEAAGVVIDVGSEGIVGRCGPIQVGDEVIVFRTTSAYADQIVANASSILARPPSLTWEQSGGLMLAATTAAHTLIATSVHEGDTVLIHGAGGGVGLMAVQLAIAKGAVVIATASEPQHELLRELGAIPIMYGPGLTERALEISLNDIDSSIDIAGTDEALDTSLAITRDRERIVTIVNFVRGTAEGIKVLGSGNAEETAIRDNARLDVLAAVSAGKLNVFVEKVFPLSEAADAHRAISGGHNHGKLILVP